MWWNHPLKTKSLRVCLACVKRASLMNQKHICASTVSCIYLLTDSQYKYTLRMLMGISHGGISISSGVIALLVCANTRRATIEQPAEGCTPEFEVSSKIRLSKRQLKKSQTTAISVRTNGPCVPGDVRPITWENERDKGAVSSRAGKGQDGW